MLPHPSWLPASPCNSQSHLTLVLCLDSYPPPAFPACLQGKKLNEIVSERWGSLTQLTAGLTEGRRAAHGEHESVGQWRVHMLACLPACLPAWQPPGTG